MVIIGSHRDISTVDDFGPTAEGVGSHGHIVASTESCESVFSSLPAQPYVLQVETTAPLSDTRRTKPRTWTVRSASVEWCPNEGNVILLRVAGKARVVIETTES